MKIREYNVANSLSFGRNRKQSGGSSVSSCDSLGSSWSDCRVIPCSSNESSESSLRQQYTSMSDTVALGAGCFYDTEYMICNVFEKKYPGAIVEASVGYMSPYGSDSSVVQHPTHEQVSQGHSGHIQVLLVKLKQPEIYFEELIRLFFQIHDPTSKYRQGNQHRGFQYSSWVFCGDKHQRKIVRGLKNILERSIQRDSHHMKGMNEADDECEFDEIQFDRSYAGARVVTCISPLSEFTKASEEHQQYYMKNSAAQAERYESMCQQMYFTEWPMSASLKRDALEDEEDGDGSTNSLSSLSSSKRIYSYIRRRMSTSLDSIKAESSNDLYAHFALTKRLHILRNKSTGKYACVYVPRMKR